VQVPRTTFFPLFGHEGGLKERKGLFLYLTKRGSGRRLPSPVRVQVGVAQFAGGEGTFWHARQAAPGGVSIP